MKKAVKITLVVVSIVIVLGGGVGAFVGTLLYTKNNINYTVGEATVTGFIVPGFPEFAGYIKVEVPFELTNNGLYSIHALTINLVVYGDDFTLTPFLNGLKLGEGANNLGDVVKGSTWSGTLALNMTLEIATLAVRDGTLEIHVDVSLKLGAIPFTMPTEIQTEPWEAPY
ncbi:MAG: hypothetical protein ACTSO7_09635 [Candidatus Heimdallarchaeota archaeon]